MRNLIALAFSDVHAHNFKMYNDGEYNRLQWSLDAMDYIFGEAKTEDVPVLFTGDLHHTPKELESPVLIRTMQLFKKYRRHKKFRIAAISGNHDFFTRNTPRNSSPSYLDAYSAVFRNFHQIDNKAYQDKNIIAWGVPYYDNDKHIAEMIEKAPKFPKGKLRILMLHCDAPGAKTPDGLEIGETEHIPTHMDAYFKNWDLVLFGHIHLPQQLSEKAWMLGPPIHQDRSSIGHKFGYWEIYSNGDMQHIYLGNIFPEFVIEGNPAKEHDYIVPKEIDEVYEEAEEEDKVFNVTAQSNDLARRYFESKKIKSKAKEAALTHILNVARS
jgi:DNA repair exonuclease SbcCD nuclease subunit